MIWMVEDGEGVGVEGCYFWRPAVGEGGREKLNRVESGERK